MLSYGVNDNVLILAGDMGTPGVLAGELPLLCTASCLCSILSDLGGLGVGLHGLGEGGSHRISGGRNRFGESSLLLVVHMFVLLL